jgi:serine/threonine-protein kinase HipA
MTFFGVPVPPKLDLSKKNLEEMAKEIVSRSIAVTGVQPKLSLTIEKIPGDNKNSRLTIVGVMGGNFILKPQSEEHLSLPENEDLTMHLSKLLEIKTSKHSLIRLVSGALAYITRRFDRVDGDKIPCEDLCQLSEELTEYKYRGSMERAGKIIKQYATYPMLDALSFFEIALFSFLTGNADMHLKNFSILRDVKNNYMLSPCYDLLSTKLAHTGDNEEMALTLNGKKSRIERKDFDAFGKTLGLTGKQVESVCKKFSKQKNSLLEFVSISFLPAELKQEYQEIINTSFKKLSL